LPALPETRPRKDSNRRGPRERVSVRRRNSKWRNSIPSCPLGEGRLRTRPSPRF